MRQQRSRVWIGILIAVVLVVVAVGSFGVYIAGEAGRLPWQAEPTRIAVTPFANLPDTPTPVSRLTPREAPMAGAVRGNA
jgi:hypothetical protein